jgi:hypothetical protein
VGRGAGRLACHGGAAGSALRGGRPRGLRRCSASPGRRRHEAHLRASGPPNLCEDPRSVDRRSAGGGTDGRHAGAHFRGSCCAEDERSNQDTPLPDRIAMIEAPLVPNADPAPMASAHSAPRRRRVHHPDPGAPGPRGPSGSGSKRLTAPTNVLTEQIVLVDACRASHHSLANGLRVKRQGDRPGAREGEGRLGSRTPASGGKSHALGSQRYLPRLPQSTPEASERLGRHRLTEFSIAGEGGTIRRPQDQSWRGLVRLPLL